MISTAQAFIAYDCGGLRINITSFNSLQVDFCDITPPSKTQNIPRMQLIQKAETHMTSYKSYSINIEYHITRCSAFSNTQIVEGVYSEIVLLGYARCSEIHQRLSYQLPLGGVITGLKINDTTFAAHTIAGSIDKDGSRTSTTFRSEKGIWNKIIVLAEYKIHLIDGTAIVNNNQNTLILSTGKIIRSIWHRPVKGRNNLE